MIILFIVFMLYNGLGFGMKMVFNFCFKHTIYATVIYNSFDGWNNKRAGNMKYASRERCRVGF